MSKATAEEKEKAASKKWITPVGILSYPYLAEPQASDKPGRKPKYSMAILFDGNDPKIREALKAGEAALLEAAEGVFGTKAAQMLKTGQLKQPFRRDWEAKGYPEGTIYFNTRTEFQPGFVYGYPDASGKPAKVEAKDIRDVFYPGAKVRISVVAYYYDTDNSKGVTFGLSNIQKIGDGPRLDGRVAAENEFEADPTLAPDMSELEG